MPSFLRPLSLLLALALPAGLLGCERRFTLEFVAQVGGEPLRCDTTYAGIGASGSTLQLLDFKAYVRDVHLVRANGQRHRLVLDQDKRWQRETVALLDFEDGTGGCNTGSPDVRTEVSGRVFDADDYTGVEFTLGVPPERNHLNVDWQEPPLDIPSMWWSWKDGYKFVRLDVRADGNRTYVFHLGSDGCEGTTDVGITCASDNQAHISLQGFRPGESRVVFDVAALFSHTDFHANDHGGPDLVDGCMSSPDDPECSAFLQQVGLGEGAPFRSSPDAFIRLE
ncbi:MAG: metallo-mystery pair system four-Cys motif protein [Myxococcaceae bacterium]|nr:metallo-mystery pair system four-Cys motif protein [Myxococcaceae bacterium]